VLALLTVLGYSVDLQAWERPAPEVIRPNLPISLLGCNYRSPVKTTPDPHIRAVPQSNDEVEKTSMNVFENGETRPTPAATAETVGRDVPAADPPQPAPPGAANQDQLGQVLQVVQEGLRSMQALQQQTAAAHQRFLETQEQAHKSFQMVIETQQRLMAGALGLPSAPLPAPIAARSEAVAAPAPPPPAPVSAPAAAGASGESSEPEAIEAARVGTIDTAAATDQSEVAGVEFERIVLEAVAELTGYPAEMLNLDMDMEADLGIDSIKRLEIFGAVQRRVPEMESVSSQHMGELRTLRNIIEYVQGAVSAPSTDATESTPLSETPQPTAPAEVAAAPQAAKLERRVLTTVDLPPARQRALRISSGYEVWVTDDGTPLAPTLVKRLKSAGQAARVLGPRAGWKNAAERKVAGLILLATPTETRAGNWSEPEEDELRAAFNRVKSLGPNLRAAAESGGALLVAVSRLDGAFGLRDGAANPLQGGLSGLAKTVAQEWPEVRCRALDVSPDWQDAGAIADAIIRELGEDGPIEVGLSETARVGLDTVAKPATLGNLPLEEGDVVVISGGARGVTAETALTLARERRLTLVLLGRSPEPTPEPDWLAGLADEAEIKRALLANGFDPQKQPSPAELETEYRQRMANREVSRNTERLRSTGSTVLYRSIDIRDEAAVAALLAEVRREHGPIRGLIHGAGVIEDRYIEDKTPEQFARVFDTKVSGLRALLEAVREDDLRCIVLFSSVSGRFGRAGQVDYAIANEVLNKVAHSQAALRPGCRVVSINWGPWDGGMVSPGLKQEFARLGVGLIPLKAGARCLVDELSSSDRDAVEVLIGDSLPVSPSVPSPARPSRPVATDNGRMPVTFERVLDVETHPFLTSHVIGGNPVLPVAMILEWLGHGALHDNPGLVLHGFDDFRVLKGVILDSGPRIVRVCASRARRSGDTFDVQVELRSGPPGEKELIHARAKMLLATQRPQSPTFELPTELHERPFVQSAEEVYRDILFHGPHFHAIKSVTGISRRGMVADVRSAPAPAEWMSQPLRSSWLADPLVVDAGMQLGSIWCHEELGAVSLPSYGATCRQYQPFPPGGVTTVLEVQETGPQRMAADVTFLDARGTVVARMERHEWTVDRSLQAAFEKNAVAV
jgi:NAD(P)-dependent dehydrogenase (short-subunit alcohol dehydrogenase family)